MAKAYHTGCFTGKASRLPINSQNPQNFHLNKSHIPITESENQVTRRRLKATGLLSFISKPGSVYAGHQGTKEFKPKHVRAFFEQLVT